MTRVRHCTLNSELMSIVPSSVSAFIVESDPDARTKSKLHLSSFLVCDDCSSSSSKSIPDASELTI